MPLVSIIIPLHNKGPFIAETLASVRAQTVAEWEAIVVENGSRDEGPGVVRTIASEEHRIRMIEAPASSTGPGSARNLGLREARGTWILFLDADDLIAPDYLHGRLSNAALDHPPDLIVGPWREFHTADQQSSTIRYPAGWQDKVPPVTTSFCYAPWALHAALIRRDQLARTNPWNEELDQFPSEDCSFWFRQIFSSTISWSDNPGALYRVETPGSRDRKVNDPRIAFEACRRNIWSNAEFLMRQDLRPSAAQAALAVRVLRRRLQQARSDLALKKQIKEEISHWLTLISWTDFRMLAWRLAFFHACRAREGHSQSAVSPPDQELATRANQDDAP